MPNRKHTVGERWTHFLTFVAVWVVAATVGSALLFYFTADSDAPPTTDTEPVTEQVAAPSEPVTAAEPVAASAVESASPAPSAATPPPPSPSPSPPAPRAARRPVMTANERAAKVSEHLRAATTASEAGDYDTAIQNYDRALELDPNNFEVKILRDQVESLQAIRDRETVKRFRESRTEIVSGGTTTESTAAEITIELNPASPDPGDPYILRVRLHNHSNELLSLDGIELVDTHASLKRERGRVRRPLAQQLGPKENALLWETRGDWTESDRSGVILVAITLRDGSRLSKSLRW